MFFVVEVVYEKVFIDMLFGKVFGRDRFVFFFWGFKVDDEGVFLVFECWVDVVFFVVDFVDGCLGFGGKGG